MKVVPLFLLLLVATLALCGCKMKPQSTVPLPAASGDERPTIATSLFPSDQAVLGDEAVARILSSRVELPAKAKLALMRFPDSQGWGSPYYGYYWRDAEHIRIHEAQVEALSAPLLASERITEVTPLPSLMTPRQISLPTLREAAVRMQADLLLVFRVGTDTYSRSRAFAKDKVKAYSTCKVVLLDVRTGLVPFARVFSRERSEEKTSADMDLSETTRRAEQASALDALRAAAEDLANFVKSVPRKDG